MDILIKTSVFFIEFDSLCHMTTDNNNNSEQLTNACVIAYLNSINRRLGRIHLSAG